MNQQAISTRVVQSHGNPLDGNILFMFNSADLLVLFALSVTFVKPSTIEMAQKYNAGQIPTELLTIVVNAILEKPVNSEGASNNKEDTPEPGDSVTNSTRRRHNPPSDGVTICHDGVSTHRLARRSRRFYSRRRHD
ncbi:hypothetical protein Tco_1229781 [Tanacetum coccineum]